MLLLVDASCSGSIVGEWSSEESMPHLRDRGGLSYTGTDLKPHVNFSVLMVTLGTLLHGFVVLLNIGECIVVSFKYQAPRATPIMPPKSS